MIRTFKITNGDGAEYDLNDQRHWLYSPSGLGYRNNSEYFQIGSDFVKVNESSNPENISGSLLFTGEDPYFDYHEFILFAQIEPLTITYNDDFCVRVDVASIRKTEIDPKTRALKCPVSFKRLGRWYREFTIRNDEEITEPHQYNYIYDYRYSFGGPGEITFETDSAHPSPCAITIHGPVENPEWSMYCNEKLITTGKVNATIQQNESLRVDTTHIPYSIKKIDAYGNVIDDLYQFSDFSTERFMFMNYGKNRFVCHDASGNNLVVELTVRVEYESV